MEVMQGEVIYYFQRMMDLTPTETTRSFYMGLALIPLVAYCVGLRKDLLEILGVVDHINQRIRLQIAYKSR